jgi:hypothetical protein
MKKLLSVCCILISTYCLGININIITNQDLISSNLSLNGFKLAMADGEGEENYGYRCTIEGCSKVVNGVTYQGHYRHCAIDLPEYSCVSSDCNIECDAGL